MPKAKTNTTMTTATPKRSVQRHLPSLPGRPGSTSPADTMCPPRPRCWPDSSSQPRMCRLRSAHVTGHEQTPHDQSAPSPPNAGAQQRPRERRPHTRTKHARHVNRLLSDRPDQHSQSSIQPSKHTRTTRPTRERNLLCQRCHPCRKSLGGTACQPKKWWTRDSTLRRQQCKLDDQTQIHR